MTKPTKWVCAQRRLRSAWAFAQSDQSRRCALNEWLRTQAFFMRIAKTLIRLGRCPGWSESSLGAQPFYVGFVMSRLKYILCSISQKLISQLFEINIDIVVCILQLILISTIFLSNHVCGGQLNAHYYSAASLKYHATDSCEESLARSHLNPDTESTSLVLVWGAREEKLVPFLTSLVCYALNINPLQTRPKHTFYHWANRADQN